LHYILIEIALVHYLERRAEKWQKRGARRKEE
jgi:hypothetical protein